MDRFELTEPDVQIAKDQVIQMLTNELLRARAELAALRRSLAEQAQPKED